MILSVLDDLSDNDGELVEEEDVEDGNMEEDVNGEIAAIQALNYDGLDN